jgi:hypothetical protein
LSGSLIRSIAAIREPPVADSRALLVEGIDLGGQR